MSQQTENTAAAAGPVERPVRPWGWHAGDGTPAHPAERVGQWPAHNRERMKHAVYDQAALDAAVAAERERCVPDVDELAQHIRWLNGSHKTGAGSLAEKLVDWLRSRS